MRIISGTLKGRSINFLKNSITRPLKDSVKENIFNILKHSNLIDVVIENSNILDLYSGIGSFGLESISRGARNVTFVEQDKNAANILEKGGSALDAVEQGCKVEETNEKGQSVGKGGLPDRDGNVTLDACIMDEKGNYGAVLGVENIMHVISVARKVMEDTHM